MIPTKDDSGLLKTLRALYSRFMELFMQTRSTANRGHYAAGASLDIVSPLSEYIDKLSADASVNTKDVSGSRAGITGEAAPDHDSSSMSVSSPNAEPGDLSVYFRNARKHSAVSLDMGEKLVHSTWEHIHTSIRVARQGDVKTARMHVELAGNALKEAERYLSAEEFSVFSEEVMSVLNEINGRPDEGAIHQ